MNYRINKVIDDWAKKHRLNYDSYKEMIDDLKIMFHNEIHSMKKKGLVGENSNASRSKNSEVRR